MPLHCGSYCGELEVARLLVEHGADVVDAEDKKVGQHVRLRQ